MKKSKNVSVRTFALLIAAILLLAGGTVTGVQALPRIQSEYYRAQFYMNHLQVHLIENGRDVCGGQNSLDGQTKVTGQLAAAASGYTTPKYVDDDNLGSAEPGKLYDEVICAENGQDTPQYIRLTVRRYWVETDENGKVVEDANGKPVKVTVLNPSQIHLMYRDYNVEAKANKAVTYNTGAWIENESERTSESRTYYYKHELAPNAKTEPLFDKLMIDPSVVELGEVIETKEGNKTVYTYVYKYDGYAFFIEADVQAVQNHNATDAIRSQWGVYNVTVSDGVLTVQ